MVDTYDAVGTQINVIPRARNETVGFDSPIVLIAQGTDGSAIEGESYEINNLTEVEELFGADSRLTAAYKAADANAASDVHAIPVSGQSEKVPQATIDSYTFETQSEAESAADSLGAVGTHYHPDDDTYMPFEYHARLEQALVNQGQASVNHVDHTPVAETAMDLDPRYVYVDSVTAVDVLNTLDVITQRATDFNFARVVAPITQKVTQGSATAYDPRVPDQRLIEVAPLEASVDGSTTTTAAAVVGAMSRKALGSSLSYDTISVDALGEAYRPSVGANFDRVTAVAQDGAAIDGVTTSMEKPLQDIFKTEIVDASILGVREVIGQYKGSVPSTPDAANELVSDIRILLEDISDQAPPLLQSNQGDPYTVIVDDADDGKLALTVGVQPVDVLKEVCVDMNVGNVTTVTSDATVGRIGGDTDSDSGGTTY